MQCLNQWMPYNCWDNKEGDQDEEGIDIEEEE